MLQDSCDGRTYTQAFYVKKDAGLNTVADPVSVGSSVTTPAQPATTALVAALKFAELESVRESPSNISLSRINDPKTLSVMIGQPAVHERSKQLDRWTKEKATLRRSA